MKAGSGWKFFSLLLLINLPKINLISVPGYEQGIRIEDILLIGSIVLWIGRGKFFILNKSKSVPMFIVLFISAALSSLNGFGLTSAVFVTRWLEYFLYINLILICYKGSIIMRVLETTVILQFLVILYQFLSGVPRPSGTLAGPWEVSLILLLIITIRSVTNANSLFLGFIAVVGIILTSTSTANVILVILAFLKLLRKLNMNQRKIFFGGIQMLLILMFIRFSEYIYYVADYMFETIEASLSNQLNASSFYEAMSRLIAPSLAMRLSMWLTILQKYTLLPSIFFGFVFGLGPGVGGVIVDGLYARVFLEFGVLGILAFGMNLLSISKTFRLSSLIVLGVFAITIDIVTSSRIMFFISLLIVHERFSSSSI